MASPQLIGKALLDSEIARLRERNTGDEIPNLKWIAPSSFPGPVEWLGTKTKGRTSVHVQIRNLKDEQEACNLAEAYYTEAVIEGVGRSYDANFRVQFIVTKGYGSDKTWPTVRFLGECINWALDDDGFVEPRVFADYMAYWEGASMHGGKATTNNDGQPSLDNAVAIAIAILDDVPPTFMSKDKTVQLQWRHVASHSKERLFVHKEYRKKCVNPKLMDATDMDWEKDNVLHPTLVKAVRAYKNGDGGKGFRDMMEEELIGVYSFPIFTEPFCQSIIDELESFEASGLPLHRPNSMNNYGVVVNDIGMGGFMSKLQRDVTQPISYVLFPEEGQWLDHHHSFSVRYKGGEDLGLDMHTDDSDVTFNVCLGKPGFKGAGLTFCGIMGAPNHRLFQYKYTHSIGRCVVHLGRQRHGADDITDGTRINLIMWNQSMVWRMGRAETPYSREEAEPSVECLSYTHDRDYDEYVKTPPGSKRKKKVGEGWCPPPGFEHVAVGE